MLRPQMPRAVDADAAGLVLAAEQGGTVSDAVVGERHASVDSSRHLFDADAVGEAWRADVAHAYEFGALATAAQLVGAGQAMLDAAVDYAKQRAQFGRVIGPYQAIKHKLADLHIALELARPLVYGAALSLADRSPDTDGAANASLTTRWPPRAFSCTAASRSPGNTTCNCISNGRRAVHSCWVLRGMTCAG